METTTPAFRDHGEARLGLALLDAIERRRRAVLGHNQT
jgi:hypothetical protein